MNFETLDVKVAANFGLLSYLEEFTTLLTGHGTGTMKRKRCPDLVNNDAHGRKCPTCTSFGYAEIALKGVLRQFLSYPNYLCFLNPRRFPFSVRYLVSQNLS